VPATGPNQVWAHDFVFDGCANEADALKCLTVVDEYTREALATDVAGRIRSAPVVEVLARLVGIHLAPWVLRSDNAPEFVSRGPAVAAGQRHQHGEYRIPASPGRTASTRARMTSSATSASTSGGVVTTRSHFADRAVASAPQCSASALEPRVPHPFEYKATLGLQGATDSPHNSFGDL
jgi:hypothetical protein